MMPERRRTPPLPYDREAAERLAARFAELSEEARRFAAGAEGAALLAAIGGNSPFLSDLAVREPATLLDAVAGRGPDAALADALGALAPRSIPAPPGGTRWAPRCAWPSAGWR